MVHAVFKIMTNSMLIKMIKVYVALNSIINLLLELK